MVFQDRRPQAADATYMDVGNAGPVLTCMDEWQLLKANS